MFNANLDVLIVINWCILLTESLRGRLKSSKVSKAFELVGKIVPLVTNVHGYSFVSSTLH